MTCISRTGVGFVVVVGWIVLWLAGCSSDIHESENLCADTADSDFEYDNDAYRRLVDSLMDSKFGETPDSIFTVWSRRIVEGWFEENSPGSFWSLCDSLFHIKRVLYSYEAGSVDGPGYQCNAIVCTDSGLLAIGSFGTLSGPGEIHVALSTRSIAATNEWISVKLQDLANALARPDTSQIDPHSRGIAIEQLVVGGKRVVALINGRRCLFGSHLDSLCCYIYDLLAPVAEEASRHQFPGTPPTLPPHPSVGTSRRIDSLWQPR